MTSTTNSQIKKSREIFLFNVIFLGINAAFIPFVLLMEEHFPDVRQGMFIASAAAYALVVIIASIALHFQPVLFSVSENEDRANTN